MMPATIPPLRSWRVYNVARWVIGALAGSTVTVGIAIGFAHLHLVGLQILAVVYIGIVGVWLAVVDLRTHLLPNRLIFPSYGVLGALLAISWGMTGEVSPILCALVSAAVTGLLYAATARWGSLGHGDVKLGVLLALLLGWIDWRAAIAGPVAGFLLGGLVAIALLSLGKGKSTHLAFGPYLIAGALFVAVRQLGI